MDRPICFWDDDPKQTNLESLDLIDEKYFQAVAQSLSESLKVEPDSEQVLHEILIQYSLSLEGLFALLVSIIQSPAYFYAWIVSYRPKELVTAVEHINKGHSIYSPLKLSPLNWASIAKFLLGEADSAQSTSSKLFAEVWTRLASDFTNPNRRLAYNRVKHGFSARKGSIRLLQIGTQQSKVEMKGSQHGHRFYEKHLLEEENKLNFYLREHFVNCEPEKLVAAIDIACGSIRNIKQVLDVHLRGIQKDINFYFLNDEAIKDFLDKPGGSLQTFSFSRRSVSYNKPLPLKAEIEELLNRTLTEELRFEEST
jgi:hypothetical protein